MTASRKQYDTNFTCEVARMVVDQGLTMAQVLQATGVSNSAIRRWAKPYKSELNGQPGQGKPLTAELCRLVDQGIMRQKQEPIPRRTVKSWLT